MSRLRLQVVTEAAQLRELKPEWNALLQSSRSDSLFLTWEWISTWWEVYGTSRLNVLVARDSTGHLVGLAPFQRVRRHFAGVWGFDSIEFIGSGSDVTPTYLDIIVSPGDEAAVIDLFVEHLSSDQTIARIELRSFADSSPHLAVIESALGGTAGRVRRVFDSVCPVLALPESPEAFLRNQSRNYRKKMGEYERRCARDLRIALRRSSATSLNRDMASLAALHQKRWRGRSRAFRSRQYLDFHERLASELMQRNWLRLFLLEIESKPVAALYCIIYRGRYLFYQSGRDPLFNRYRLGLVIMHKVIQEAIKEGATVFDFLNGDEGYKSRWADSSIRNVRLTQNRSFAARLDEQLRLPSLSVIGQ